MRKIVTYITIFIWLFAIVISCTEKDELTPKVEPGIYNIGKDLSAILDTKTRGIDSTNYQFDENYDYDYIYLHKIGTQEKLYIPVYDNCPTSTNGTCKGFRYRVIVDEDDNVTITPLNKDGDEYGTQTLTFNQNENCEFYFSSWKEDEWILPEEQIATGSWASDPDNSYYFYYRHKDINQEIYRSGNTYDYKNLDITGLTTNGDLYLTRACTAFSAVGLLYDKENPIKFGSQTLYPTNESKFAEIMGDSPQNWYIKIYMGGTCFPDHYNIETDKATNNHPNGYYSSGDVNKYEDGHISGQNFIKFSQREYGNVNTTYQGYGYLSYIGNQLFSPTKKDGEFTVYILIKHWFKEGTPSPEWIQSDLGALQTTIKGLSISPRNSNTYTLGVIIDIQEFKEAWDAAGGDEAQQAAEDAVSGSTSTTRSLSGTTVREVTIPGAKVIYDVY